MKIALAQLDFTVGDLPGNAKKIREALATETKGIAVLIGFPEKRPGTDGLL